MDQKYVIKYKIINILGDKAELNVNTFLIMML